MSDRPLNGLRVHIILLMTLLLMIVYGDTVRANGLAADVSDRLIAITTAFVGDNVVVFGSTETESPIVITIQGPRQDQMVRRKSRVAGIWINRDRIEFKDVPSFFAIAASDDLEAIANTDTRNRLELGVEYLKLMPSDDTNYSSEEITAFTKALIRNKERQGLYTVTPVTIGFPAARLFRATFEFPANVPPGLYRIEVFQLKDGQVIGAQQSSLQISKVGVEAEIYDFARKNAPLYGLAAILIAVTAGWLAGVIFRKG